MFLPNSLIVGRQLTVILKLTLLKLVKTVARKTETTIVPARRPYDTLTLIMTVAGYLLIVHNIVMCHCVIISYRCKYYVINGWCILS